MRCEESSGTGQQTGCCQHLQRCELSVGCCGAQEHIHQDYANNTLLTPCRGPDCWGAPQEVQVMTSTQITTKPLTKSFGCHIHPLIFWLRMGIGQALLYLSDVEEAGGPTAVRTSRETHRRNQHGV